MMRLMRKNRLIATIAVALVAASLALGAGIFGASAVRAGDPYEIEYVPIEEVRVYTDRTAVMPGDSIRLGADLKPYYAAETVQQVRYEISKGASLATLNEETGVLTAREDAEIGAQIEVVAVADGVRSHNTVTLTIAAIPVERVVISAGTDTILQGSALQLETKIEPLRASDQALEYRILEGAAYAEITADGLILVHNGLPAGNLRMKVQAMAVADGIESNVLDFGLYVPTRTLSLTANTLSPRLGETLRLQPIIDGGATEAVPTYTIVSGGEFIDGAVTGNELKIVDCISTRAPRIVLKCERDGIVSNELAIDVYIPADSVTVSAEGGRTTIKQGEMLQITAAVTPWNAALKHLTYFLDAAGSRFASIDEKTGLLTAKVLPEVASATVKVMARIDGCVSEELSITIVKPVVVLQADRQFPVSGNQIGETVTLTTTVDGAIQTDGVSYQVVAGGAFVAGISENRLTVAHAIPEQYKNPQIRVIARYGAYESGEIVLSVRIPVRSLSFFNESVTQVEQQKQYSFAAFEVPSNATLAGTGLTYRLNVDADIAEITQDGRLSVKASAPIGQRIIVTALGPDGVTAEHTVTVKTVYATSIRISSAMRPNGSQLSPSNPALPGEALSFRVDYEPFNVTESQKNFTLYLHAGDVLNASVNGGQVCINASTGIKNDRPAFTVRAYSEQNGTTIFADYAVSVYVPVTQVSLYARSSQLVEGNSVLLSDVLGTTLFPAFSNVKNATYEIVDGGAYARIEGATVKVNPNLPAGNLTVTFRACAEGVQSNEVTLPIYTLAKSVTLTANTYVPKSYLTHGDTVRLFAAANKEATRNNPALTVVSGAELIEGNYANGAAVPAVFNVRPNVRSSAKTIIIQAEQDGKAARMSLEVYVPVERASIDVTEIDRGVSTPFNVSFNANVSDFRWDWNSYTVAYPNGGTNSYQKTNNYGPVSVDAAAGMIKIGKNAPAGTRVTLYYRSLDAVANTFSHVFTVAKLSEQNAVSSYLDTAVSSSGFSMNYGTDSANVKITKNKMQLKEGRYTDIEMKYNGQKLSEYGISSYSLVIESGSTQFASIGTANASGKVRLCVAAGASGKTVVNYHIEVNDGSYRYTLPTQSMNIYNGDIGTLKVSNDVVNAVSMQLRVTGLKTTATAKAGDLKFRLIDSDGLSLTSEGKLSVTNSSPSKEPIIEIYCNQPYNGTTEYFSQTYRLRTPYIELDQQGGTGTKEICGPDGATKNIQIPTRTGYIFQGYYSSASSATKYYNMYGSRIAGWGTTVPTKIYAQWKPIQYTLRKFTHTEEDGYKKEYSTTINYDEAYKLTAPSKDGYTFSHWRIYPNDYAYSTDSTITVKNLRDQEGASVDLDAWYDKNACVATGTQITLADGSRVPVESLKGDESLLVWNLETGSFDTAPILFIDSEPAREYEVIRLFFSDGTEVKVISEHAFWDIDLNKYVFLRADAAQYIGHRFNKQTEDAFGYLTWTAVTLTNVSIGKETTGAWSPVTYGHLCLYVNGMLSMPAATEGLINIFEVNADTMRYKEDAFLADIETYGLFTYEEFAQSCPLPEVMFGAFKAQYLKVSIGKGLIDFETLNALVGRYAAFFND